MELSRIERNSSACALEWSIELEKALRSKKPGRAIEAIQQIGSQLQRWSREPESTGSTYTMFGLVAGEDRVFANTILLRLSDAFKFGNRETRLSIVRIFFSELLHREGKKPYKGILSESRVQNHQELLTRVKFVFDSGDSKSKALAMFLFGCWADFAKDSAQIRYLILSSLVSSHSLEVKASLFAAACFSELADDFARVVLEMVVNVVIPSVKSSIRLAGARVFAKLGCSYSVAKQAYETGLRVLLEASDEEFLVTMLVSLTKLASKSMLLSSEQVELICTFLTNEQPRLQETAFKCLHFLFKRGVSQCIDTRSIVRVVINVLDNASSSTAMQCEALRILHQILLYSLPNHSFMVNLGSSELLATFGKAFKTSSLPQSFLAIQILMDVTTKIRRGTKDGSDGNVYHFLPLDVMTSIMDRSIMLVKQLLDQCHKTSELPQEVQSLLYHLILLIEHWDFGVAGVGKVCLSLRSLAMVQGDKNKEVSLRLALIIYRYVGICIEYLNKADIDFVVFENVKDLVDFVCRSSVFNFHTNIMYAVLLHSKFILGCLVNEDKEICDCDGNASIKLREYVIKHEVLSISFARKLLLDRFNWQAYRAGSNATSNGGWFLASFVFGNLVTKVSSNSCRFWLKSLDKFSFSELKIQLLPLMLSNDDLHLAKQHDAGSSIMLGYSEKLFEAYQCLRSASKMLEIAVTPDQSFCFQRWFLYLRAKTVAMLGSVFKILGAISFNQSSGCNNLEFGANKMDTFLKLLQELTNLSHSFKTLAIEFDIVLTSFIGMDSKSSKIISELGLSCSLLAFCTGFALFVPELAKSLETTDDKNLAAFSSMLVQNLVGRLWSIDDEMDKNLSHLLTAIGGPKKCLHLQSRNQILDSKCAGSDIIKLCRYGIDGIVCLINKASGLDDTTFEHVTKRGFEYLYSILIKWTRIPFKNPKHFFSTRPCVRSELFAVEEGTRKTSSISICSGHQLSLSLCLQLKHFSPDLPLELKKFYCILFCKSSFQEASGDQTPLLQPWQDDDIIEMSEKLSRHVIELRTKISIFKADYKVGVAQATVQMEVNDGGQGFSSCLLDVSEFPIGCYRIKWFSCCIDSRGCYWSLLPVNAGPAFTIID